MINRFNQINQIICFRNQRRIIRGFEGWSIIIRIEQKYVIERDLFQFLMIKNIIFSRILFWYDILICSEDRC